MRVLITGATGYIGGAVGGALQRAGHQVLGLARSGDAEAAIRRRGWTAVSGDLRDPVGLERQAAGADAVVHVGNTGGADAAEVDTVATRALLAGLEGTGRAFVYTSGAWVLGAAGKGVADEAAAADPIPLVEWRAGLESEVRAAAPGVRSVVLRPGIVFGGGGGIVGMLARGEIPVVGDGSQRWPLVHLDDLADLYVRALGAPAGSVLHGVAATATMRELALLARARGDSAPATALAVEEARRRFGAFADALALDQVVSAEGTRRAVGWRPARPSVIEEFLAGPHAAEA